MYLALDYRSKIFKELRRCVMEDRNAANRVGVSSGVGGASVVEMDPETGKLLVICYLCGEKVSMASWNDCDEGHRTICPMKCKYSTQHKSAFYNRTKMEIVLCSFERGFGQQQPI